MVESLTAFHYKNFVSFKSKSPKITLVITCTDKNTQSHNTDNTRWPSDNANNPKSNALDNSMTRSDSSSFTTWSKLKKCGGNSLRRHPSGNNNNSENDASHLGLTENTNKSQSMPNLCKRREKLRSLTTSVVQRNPSNSSVSTILNYFFGSTVYSL